MDTSKNLDTDPKKPFKVRTFQNQMPNKPESNGLIEQTQHSGWRFLEVSKWLDQPQAARSFGMRAGMVIMRHGMLVEITP